jgi:hypothetical protein
MNFDASVLFSLQAALAIQSICGSIWILGFFFYFYRKKHEDFDRDYIESVHCFRLYGF